MNIQIPLEQKANDYVDVLVDFKYFFVRKVMFVKYAMAFVILPGGYGTLDEFTEALNLIQTHRIARFPVVLYNSQYWKGMVDWIGSTVVKAGHVCEEEMEIFTIADTPQEVVAAIRKFYKKPENEKRLKAFKRPAGSPAE